MLPASFPDRPEFLIPRKQDAVNDRPALLCNNVALQSTCPADRKPVTVVVAARTPASPSGTLINGVGGGLSLDVFAMNWRALKQDVDLIGQTLSGIAADSTTVIAFTYDASDVWTWYLEGVEKATGTKALTFIAGKTFGFGSHSPSGSALAFGGHLGEVFVYDRVLTTPERQQVEQYLTTKWKLPAPPTDLPIPSTGLRGWFDAADASTFTDAGGGLVSAWRDRSSAGRNLFVLGGANPLRGGSQNGLPYCSFRIGTTGLFYNGSRVPDDNFTIISVARTVDTAARSYFMSAGQRYLFHTNANFKYGVRHEYAGGSIEDGAESINTWSIHGYLHSGPMASGTTTIRRDGTLAVTSSAAYAAGDGLFVGGGWTGDGWRANTDIAEVVMYDRVLSPAEITQVERYLGEKWGILVDPTGVDGLCGWWDADDAATFTLTGTLIEEWRDKSPSNTHLAAPGANYRPPRTGTQNGRTTVLFPHGYDFNVRSPRLPPLPPTGRSPCSECSRGSVPSRRGFRPSLVCSFLRGPCRSMATATYGSSTGRRSPASRTFTP